MTTMVERVVEVINDDITSPRQQDKERLRKSVKKRHPHNQLKWLGTRWAVLKRRKADAASQARTLEESGIRTIGIGLSLAKIKQFGNKADAGIRRMKSLSTQLGNAKDEKERNKIEGEITAIDADVLWAIRKMEMYSALLSASGLVGIEKTITKTLKKQKRR